MHWIRRGEASCHPSKTWPMAVGLLLALVASEHLFAVQIMRDQFLTGGNAASGQYNVASVIAQNPTIPGFSGIWFSSNGSSMNVAASSLTYSSGLYPLSAGGRLFSDNNSSRIHRLFDATLNPFQSSDTGTIYLSYLYQNSLSTGNGYIALEMHNGATSDSARTFQLGVSQGSSDFPNGNNFGFRVNNSASLSRALGTRNTTVNLFVVKFVLSASAGGDAITVWHNPSVDSLTSEPAGGVTVSGFDFVADRMGVARFNTNSSYDFSIDELRIGTTWGDVLSDSFLACDINGNGVCNSSDMRILSQNMFTSGGYEQGDLNADGMVDFADYRLLKDDPARVSGFDSHDINVPEPTTLLLVVLAAIAFNQFMRKRSATLAVLVIIAGCTVCKTSHAQTAPTGPITTFSGATLHMKRYASIPTSPIISMTTQPLTTGNQDLFVTTQNGNIYSLRDTGSSVSVAPFFNYNATVSQFVVNASNGFVLDTTNSMHGGLRNISFHPEFALNGKFYTSALVDRPDGVPGLNYIGTRLANPAAESLVAEWTYDRTSKEVTGYRELFRVQMPVFDHPVKQMGFNPFARPGDEDYGLLYIAHGDGSVFSTTVGGGAPDNALGKVLRINPLQDGMNRYTTPGNVLAGQAGYLPEIFTLGHRNPHHLSFAKDADGDTHIIVAEPGRDNIEEVNVLHNGGNYGWSSREGTWVQLTNSGGFGIGVGLQNLPANEWQLNDFYYPSAQYDHSGGGAISIAGGFVIQNHSDPQLQDQYIFSNHASGNGWVFQAGLDDMLSAHTQLADGELPSALTQATISRLHLTLDSDGDGDVDRTSDDMNQLLQQTRNDVRYGRGSDGQMFISSKTTGQVYLVTNTVPEVDRLTLTVNRTTGDMTITNSTGIDVSINRLSLTSPSGSLEPMSLEPLDANWSLAPSNTNQSAVQSSASSALNFGSETMGNLGAAYDAQLVAFGQSAGEDLVFVFETDDGTQTLGNVIYTGESQVLSTIVMMVDLGTGAATLRNATPFTQEVEGYTITSVAGSINTAGWNSFEGQGIDDGDWFASPTDAKRLTELQDDGTTTFDEATTYSLGEIYEIGATPDLRFEFLLAGESELRDGLVVYVLPGDFDDDLDVDGADFLVWQRGGSPDPMSASDLAAWQQNYGIKISMPLATVTVPEPGGLCLAILAGMCMLTRRTNPRTFIRPLIS